MRRSAILLVIALTTVLGLAGTAQAAFTGRTTLAPVTVSTLTVVPPTALSTTGTYCSTYSSYYYGTWYSSSTLHARISWKASTTTRGVSGYRITAWLPDGSSYGVGDVAATTTAMAMDVDGSYARQGIRVTVTTLTSYGWTADSAKSGALTC